MKFGSISPMTALILMAAFMALSSSGICSDDGTGDAQSGTSPLYDYRYSQVAEDLGLLDNGTSENKLGFESIPTASLSPEDKCEGKDCRQVTRQGDDDTSMITCGGVTSCGGIQTCGSTCGGTCGDSCGSTCTQTCASSCGMVSCGAATSCGGVYTCASTCGLATCGGATSCGGVQTCSSTCANSCGQTCTLTCTASCGAVTCGGATSCGGILTCASTCSSTCGSTCAQTCVASCGRATACGGVYTCASTCSRTCGYTCYSTCFGTCGYTCANTCAQTCTATCAPNCAINLAPQRNAPMANSTIKTPTAIDQNSVIPYDVRASPPPAVYYNGANIPWAAFNQSLASNSLLAWTELYDRSWGTSASAPIGTWVREFIYVPTNGSIVLSMNTGGINTRRDFGPTTPGFKYIWFYADRPGAHVSTFSIKGVQSNPVTIFAY